MGDLTEEASQVAAAFRIILSTLGMAFGIVWPHIVQKFSGC